MRWRAVVAAVLLALLGTVVVLTPTLYFSWRVAISQRQDDLDRASARTLRRADEIYADAASVLRSIAGTDFVPCSLGHVRRMMQLTLRSLTVHAVAYGANGFALCNGAGRFSRPVPLQKFNSEQPDGIGLVVNWRGWTSGREPNLIMVLGEHRVLVDQRLFYGEPFAPVEPWSVTLRTHNGVVLESGFEDKPAAPPDGPPITSEAQSANWVVSASAPGIGFFQYLTFLGSRLVLLASSMALTLGAISMWLLLRPRSLRSELTRAVRNREFIVHYQPIIELATGRCFGAEALVRWQRPDGRLVRPDLFIPLAEETGQIRAITDQVIATAVRDLGDVMGSDPSVHVSINICAKDFSSGRLGGVLEKALLNSRISAGQIWLEVTERSLVDVADARATLAGLRQRGHIIAIDDFGTGYSSLSYLNQLSAHMLKIDKSFVETLGTEAATSQVTAYIISMAQELDLGLVAEGVETEAQCDFLREKSVQFAQGWLFAPALPLEGFLAFHRGNRRRLGTPAAVVPLAG
jgi:sensor c-di-GMP phosphodiesterase-like protein